MEKLTNRPWDSVNEGDTLPPVSFGPITITQLVRDATGTRDLYPIHHDREFAKSNGHRDSFLNTMWYHGFFGRYVSIALMPVLLGALLVHAPNGWLFTAANGGWEYPAFLVVAALTHILAGDGAFAVRPASLPVLSGERLSPKTA